jgi:hypothetical protein
MKSGNKSFSKSKIQEQKWENKIKHPVFCFKYLHKDFHVDKCNADEKICLLEQIIKLSNLSWQEIEYSGRHGLGTEKIDKNSIRKDLPKDITEDVSYFLALRFGGKKAFVGFRNKFIFHILYIDRDFTLYKH